MTANDAWAATVLLCDEYSQVSPTPFLPPDPLQSVMSLTHNCIPGGGPTEVYSLDLPHPPSQDETIRPIDSLYGSYSASARKITIYAQAIERDKALYGATYQDFLYIVRLHEYAHAIVHLGLRLGREQDVLEPIAGSNPDPWTQFFSARNLLYGELAEDVHEFLAQGITLGCLKSLQTPARARFVEVFESLETFQPPHYHVSSALLNAFEVRWQVALDCARGDLDAARGEGFNLRQGLESVMTFDGPDASEAAESQKEWVLELDQDATESLKNTLRLDSQRNSSSQYTELLVDSIGGLKIELFAREHPPPHFRVKTGGQTANFRIKDCHKMNGGLEVHYRAIRQWHVENKQMLVSAWNEHRPDGCPVGPYRE